jgi:uncharacterized protein
MSGRRKQSDAADVAAAPPGSKEHGREHDRDAPLVRALGPSIRDLAPQECLAVLGRHTVARIAYAFERHVDIVPVHYVYDGGWLYGRTSDGGKLQAWRHSHWVAAEVDEVRGLFDWVSVVVHGTVHVLGPEGGDDSAAAWEHAVALLRRLVPQTGTVYDPVPHRTVLFRIHVDEMTGRECQPGPPPA